MWLHMWLHLSSQAWLGDQLLAVGWSRHNESRGAVNLLSLDAELTSVISSGVLDVSSLISLEVGAAPDRTHTQCTPHTVHLASVHC